MADIQSLERRIRELENRQGNAKGDYGTVERRLFESTIIKMTAAERVAMTDMVEGMMIYESDTGRFYYYSSTAVSGSAPIGSGCLWFTNTAPTGYLICDASAVSRTTYADLFVLLGTTYGVGDGSTTFNLPDLRQYVPVGRLAGDADFGTLGATGGAKTVTLAIGEMPEHSHTWGAGGGNTRAKQALYQAGTNRDGDYPGGGAPIGNTGGGGAHANLQPFFVVNFIIKY